MINLFKSNLLDLVKSSENYNLSPKIEALLIKGKNPNTLDPLLGNISLLMIAVSIENLELMQILIKYGADINFENKVLSRCIFDNFIMGFKLILNRPEISKASIEFAFFSSLLEADRIIFTKMLLQSKPEICLHARNAQGINGFEFAKRRKNQPAIELLIGYLYLL